ncbi:hypothetical protein ACFWNI_02370 [Streptomyces sp. NPDC058377]|uniref:hypothetical protein n=1 Tax=Streptomyces sp. NPDC058377 TaxID=3346468 RepID=UPI003666BE04
MPEQSNDVPPALYPELVASGGLAEALAREAVRRGRRTGPPEPVEGYGPAVAACWAHGEARFAVYAADADVREFRIEISGDSGRQTVYRWWSNKAEVLYEASAIDARHELSVPAGDGPRRGLKAYLDALVAFLSRSHAGAAYRALMGEAQHDADVAALLASRDILGESAAAVVEEARKASGTTLSQEQATALLIGPPFFHILTGRSADAIDTEQLAHQFLRALNRPGT